MPDWLPASEVPASKPPTYGFVRKFWRGEYSLPVSYWLINLGATAAVLGFRAWVSDLTNDQTFEPVRLFLAVAAIWAVSLAAQAWLSVGLWRSADAHRQKKRLAGKSAVWAGLAQLMIVASCFRLAGDIAQKADPQLSAAYQMAFENDPSIPAFTIRVMRNGTEAEVSGGFKYGLTGDFTRVLKSSPRISVVHLNSLGGRVGEGVALAALIKQAGLNTYVTNQCASACTIAFAAGRERSVLRSARLGFHSPSFPVWTASDEAQSSELMLREYQAAGFSAEAIQRARKTPHSEMWMPTVAELLQYRIASRIAQGSDFAASGVTDQTEYIDRYLKANPHLRRLEELEPVRFSQLAKAISDGYSEGRTNDQLANIAQEWVAPLIEAYRPQADDQTMLRFARLVVDTLGALRQKPTACYRYSLGDMSFKKDVPPALLIQDAELMEGIFRTAASRAPVREEEITPAWTSIMGAMQKRFGTDKLKLFSDHAALAGRADASVHADFCDMMRALYQEVAKYPEPTAARVLRWMSVQ